MVATLPPSDAAGANAPELVLYAPDGPRVAATLRQLQAVASAHWEDSGRLTPTQLARRGVPRLILLDYSAAAAEASALAAKELSELLPQVPLVALGSTAPEHAAGVLVAWRSGVRDFIDVEGSAEDFRATLKKAMQSAERSRVSAVPMARTPGRLILLLGVRPGVGTSTLAAHLGVMAQGATAASDAAERRGGILLDLGRPAGDSSLYLSVESEFHYEEALRHAGRIDATLARTALARHGASQLAVLPQPNGSLQAPPDGAETSLLVERLSSVFDLLLCDLGGLAVRQIPPALLKAAEQIWLIADQSIGAVISLDGCLRELEQLGLRDERLGLVLNRVDDDAGLAPAQLAERFALPLLAALPERSRSLRASANQGRLLHEVAPRDPYVLAMDDLLDRLSTGTVRRGGSSLLQKRLRRFGGLLWKRT